MISAGDWLKLLAATYPDRNLRLERFPDGTLALGLPGEDAAAPWQASLVIGAFDVGTKGCSGRTPEEALERLWKWAKA